MSLTRTLNIKHRGPDEAGEPIEFYNMVQILSIFLNLSSHLDPQALPDVHQNLLLEFHGYLRTSPKQRLSIKTLCLLIMIVSNLLLKARMPRHPRLDSSLSYTLSRREQGSSLEYDASLSNSNSSATRQTDKFLRMFLETVLLLIPQVTKQFGFDPSSRKEVENFLSIVLATLANFHSPQTHILHLLVGIEKQFDQILKFVISFFIENEFSDSRKVLSFLRFFCLLVTQPEKIIKKHIRKNKVFFEKVLSFLVDAEFLGFLTNQKRLKISVHADHVTLKSQRNLTFHLSLVDEGPPFPAPPSASRHPTTFTEDQRVSRSTLVDPNMESRVTPKRKRRVTLSTPQPSFERSSQRR